MSDDLKKLAEAVADKMFFGPHKPECEIPADQTMTVRYGHALQVIEAALAAMGKREAVGLAYRFDPGTQWHLVKYEDQIPNRADFPKMEVRTLYASPRPEAVGEAVA